MGLYFRAVLIAVCFGVAAPASAQERIMNAIGGRGSVLVWKNLQALQEGTDMISAGVAKRSPELVMPLLSCMVPSGTSAIVTDSSLGTRNVVVTSGERLGCRGTVNVEVLDK